MNKVAVYTSSVGNYDWIHRPRVKPAGMEFLRFSDRKPQRLAGWAHRDLPDLGNGLSVRLQTRFPKLCPQEVLAGYDIAIWIDGSVEVMGDLTPAIEAFVATQADVAMFPHPGGRSVDEEFNHAIRSGRIPPTLYDAADAQRARYVEAGVADHKIVEATIIFYRLSSQIAREAGAIWWQELTAYTERDQVSQPFAMQDPSLKIHKWDWHFDDPNPYFRRLPHRPKALGKRLRTGAHFMGDSRLDFRVIRSVIQTSGWVRRKVRTLFSASS